MQSVLILFREKEPDISNAIKIWKGMIFMKLSVLLTPLMFLKILTCNLYTFSVGKCSIWRAYYKGGLSRQICHRDYSIKVQLCKFRIRLGIVYMNHCSFDKTSNLYESYHVYES